MGQLNTETAAGPGIFPGSPDSNVEQEVKKTAGELNQEARRLTEEAKQHGQALFEGQRFAAADEIGGMVDALRKTAQGLEGEHRGSTARLAYRAADTLNGFAENLRHTDLRALVGQGEDYARRHPGIFFGGSMVAGLLLARFLKSSSRRTEARPYAGSAERHSMAATYHT